MDQMADKRTISPDLDDAAGRQPYAAPAEALGVAVELGSKGICRISLSGHLGWGTDEKLKRQIVPCAGGGSPPRSVIVDLTEVTFIDSAGISSLLTVRQTVGEWGGRLILCGVPPLIDRTFRVVGMSRLIPIVETMAQALGIVTP
jgi:anti-anti-sigma factor